MKQVYQYIPYVSPKQEALDNMPEFARDENHKVGIPVYAKNEKDAITRAFYMLLRGAYKNTTPEMWNIHRIDKGLELSDYAYKIYLKDHNWTDERTES